MAIHDGGSLRDPYLERFCGETKTSHVLSSSNEILLHFASDESVTGHGFHLSYEGVIADCGGILTDSHGTISSPGFPLDFMYHQECSWLISLEENLNIFVDFLTVNINPNSTCR